MQAYSRRLRSKAIIRAVALGSIIHSVQTGVVLHNVYRLRGHSGRDACTLKRGIGRLALTRDSYNNMDAHHSSVKLSPIFLHKSQSPTPQQAHFKKPLQVTTSPSLTINLESQLLLDLRNRQTWVQSLGTRPRTVHNGVATVDAHGVIERSLALQLLLVTRVGEPAVRLEQDGRAEVLLRVPPV